LTYPLIPKIIEFLDRVKRSPAFHCGVCYFGQAFRSLLLPKKRGLALKSGRQLSADISDMDSSVSPTHGEQELEWFLQAYF
jgi:hypothetical protein